MKSKALTSFRLSCRRERREIENLYNKKARLKALVTEVKSNNEEYNKIKHTAYEEMKGVLTDGKLVLKFATLLVIESLRMNSELCNFVIYDNSTNTTISHGPNYPSLMLSGQQQQQSFNDICTVLILEETEKLYNKLITELTNWSITATATIRESSLPLSTYNNNRN